jgi:hypothetical protein
VQGSKCAGAGFSQYSRDSRDSYVPSVFWVKCLRVQGSASGV